MLPQFPRRAVVWIPVRLVWILYQHRADDEGVPDLPKRSLLDACTVASVGPVVHQRAEGLPQVTKKTVSVGCLCSYSGDLR